MNNLLFKLGGIKFMNIQKNFKWVILLMVFVLCACTPKIEYQYMNIAAEESHNAVRDVFEKANISEAGIFEVVEKMDFFNENSGYSQMIPSGIQKASINDDIYNYETAIDNWNYDINDLNCRSISFILCSKNINFSENKDTNMDSSDIFPEISNSIMKFESNTDISNYKALFSDYKSDDLNDENIFKDMWAKRGIEFEYKDDSKLITVHAKLDNDDTVSIAHCGMEMVEGDKVIFFEKVDPFLPYKLSYFNNKEELVKYLKARIPEAKSIAVFENDSMLIA